VTVSVHAGAAVWIGQRCNGAVAAKLAIACQSSVFFRHLNEANEAGSGLKAPRSYALPEAEEAQSTRKGRERDRQRRHRQR
jgi:hypothetical protein